MSEMIERVARVLHARDDYDGYTWHDYIPDARAAIAAMREPNEKMIDAGFKQQQIVLSKPVEGLWQSMIDAALGETK
jgi:hypothetical protein